MSFSKRLKAIIKQERHSQRSFSEVVDIPLPSLESYLAKKVEPSANVVMKITNHPEFKKYTLWLMTGEIEANSGQICPTEEIQKKYGLLDITEKRKA
ncbi:transcriptional regulator [Aliivibrio fischeri]|uniref:Transcriptional regulator n=1 Tax=Aliivibrio fischeri TaxID=668 RepID=A0A510UJW5_ALIFS|nr:transcriptional regulator [Aliivibrio fischeri]GEK13195.1 transcriptional regulator [Aliivibrio fischeri]